VSASLVEWSAALVEATRTLASTTLGLEVTPDADGPAPRGSPAEGSYVALVGEGTSLQIGLSASPDGCQRLSRAFLAMPEEEGDLPEGDVADALGEMANILAGDVKRRMAERDPALKLGLPIVVRGRVQATERMETAVAALRIGDVQAEALVLRDRGRSA
jgi:chemotaxis protein CheX